MSERRDLNPRPSPWQGDALPLSYFRMDGKGKINFKFSAYFLTILGGRFSPQPTFNAVEFHQGFYRGKGVDI